MFDWLHRRMPRSLFARAALILLLPVLTVQILVSISFVQRHYEDVTRQMTRSLMLELRVLRDAAAAAPDAAAALAAARAVGEPLELTVTRPGPPPAADIRPAWDIAGRAMIRTLRAGLPETLAVDLGTPRRAIVWLDTPHGPLAVEVARRRVAATNPHQLLVLMAALTVVMIGIAALFLRNQLRPVRRLAHVAQAYGRGRVLDYRPAGATEVRAAGTAFLEMRSRLERQAQARTQMLAGISHDLRTPLTRLRLGLSMMDDPEAPALLRDVDDMTRMVDAFLAYARGDAADAQEEAPVLPLVRAVVEDFARTGRDARLAHVEGEEGPPAPLRPLAIRRALENLLANALAHGSRAEVSVAFSPGAIRLTVEDDGPGIPAERRDEAMRPFTRLDPSRNQDSPGAGLGLAIVAEVARSHGGALRLGDSALGGLRAEITLAR
jgi:two-component system osmolarity sensor histidine kinase EnvZ